MIFLTIGTDRGFDRLVKAVDSWAEKNPNIEIFGQIGRSEYRPTHFSSERFLESATFTQRVEQSDALVSHAGMGNVLTALNANKPIIVFPRRPELGELGNAHQLDTAKALAEKNLAQVAYDETELTKLLDTIGKSVPLAKVNSVASAAFCDNLQRRMDTLSKRDIAVI